MSNDNNSNGDSFTGSVQTLVLIMAIFLYFIGFVYIHFYYAYFGIPTSVTDLPLYSIFVYSYNVFESHRFQLVSIFSALVLLIFFRKLWPFMKFVLIIGMIFSFLYFFDISCEVGTSDAKIARASTDTKIIRFVFTDKALKTMPPELNDKNVVLHKISETPTRYFVVCQPTDTKGNFVDKGLIYEIHAEDVKCAIFQLNKD